MVRIGRSCYVLLPLGRGVGEERVREGALEGGDREGVHTGKKDFIYLCIHIFEYQST